ncbi:MAG: hypothetical protein NTV88_02300 [Candidatus Micrarchaeota archaeon]|nr:hypothetical protein [Candidatus Micrarchaeota archaeon]
MKTRVPSELSRMIGVQGWKEKYAHLRRRFDRFSALFRSSGYSSPDELFFSIEDLPPLGKEYWFLHFCAPPDESQVILTLGRSADAFEVNSSSLKGVEKSKPAEGSIRCAAVGWLHSGSKKVLMDTHADVRIERSSFKSSLEAKSKNSRVEIHGVYPNFNVHFSQGKREIFRARAFAPKNDLPYEIIHILNNPLVPKLSTVLVNYYFDFKGALHGKPISGKAYLQKVIAVMPLAPWNWVRINFASGAVIDFFTGKPLGHKSEVRFAGNAYFEHKGRRVKLAGKLVLTRFMDGESTAWVLTGKNLLLSMRTYSLQPFVMKQRTTFRYDEYLVRVTDFAYREGKNEHSLSSLGAGVGIVEEASGYLI